MNGRIFRGAVASAVYTATAVLVAAVQLGLIVRTLPREIVGLWLVFLTIGSYIAFFDLGISPTFGREISLSTGSRGLTEEERTCRIAELASTLGYLFRVAALSVFVISLLVGEAVILTSPHYRGEHTIAWAWLVFSLGASLNLSSTPVFASLFGLGLVATEKLIRIVSLVAGLGFTVAALELKWGILGLASAWALQGLLALGLARHQLRRRFLGLRTAYPRNWETAKRLALPSLKLACIQLGAILILQSANPIIALMLGMKAIPAYEAVSKIATTMMMLALLVVNSSTPFLSMTYAAGQLTQFRLLLFRNLRLGLSVIVVLAAFLALNGDRIVSLWLGPGMFAGFPVLWVLLLMVALEVHHVIFAAAVMAAGQIVFVWTALASGVLNIALAVLLCGRLGLLGVALAIAIGQLVTNNWYAPYVAVRFFKLSRSTLLLTVWSPMIVLLLAQLAINALLKQLPWLGGPGLTVLLINFVISLCLGAPFWWLLALRASERARLLGLISGPSRAKIQEA